MPTGDTSGESVRLPRGVRYVANDVIAIQMAQRQVGNPNGGIFVDCMTCGRRDRLAGNFDGVTDERAQAIFEHRGWTVKPTRCPDHSGHIGGAEGEADRG